MRKRNKMFFGFLAADFSARHSRLLICFFLLASMLAYSTPAQKVHALPKDAVPLSDARYLIGGIMGSTVGFGLGHAIQRRYLPMGLIYSLVEGVALFGFMSASIASNKIGVDSRGRHDFDLGLLGAVCLGTYAGFHIWEGIAVWMRVKKTSDGQRYLEANRWNVTLAPLVTPNNTIVPGLAFSWHP